MHRWRKEQTEKPRQMKKKQGPAGGKLYEKIVDVDVSTSCVSCQGLTLSADAADVRDECGVAQWRSAR